MRSIFITFWMIIMILLLSIAPISGKDSITVYLFLLDECRICQEIAPELNEIYATYHNDFGFIGLFPNFSSKKIGINNFVKKHKIPFETKTDYFKTQTLKFEATVLPEVVVFNEKTKTILYRGAINDLFYAPGKRRNQSSNHYLKDALKNIASGIPVSNFAFQPIGCFINFNDFSN